MACIPLAATLAMAALIAGVALASDLFGLTQRLTARLPDGAALPLRLASAAIALLGLLALIALRAPC